MKPLKIVAACLFAAVAAVAVTDTASARVFHHPHVGGALLDGCYSWPGGCHTRREANAFCRDRDYDQAVEWRASHRAGLIKTRRLGDDGTCVASCTVMEFVECE